MVPIWKDYTVELAATAEADGVLYRVLRDSAIGTVIFEGRAFPRPGANETIVRINDIVAPLLVRNFTPAGETDTPFISIYVQKWNRALLAWDEVDNEDFYADWSYEPDYDGEDDDLNAPPENFLMPGQLVPCTLAVNGTASYLIDYLVLGAGDFNADFNADFKTDGDAQATEQVDNDGECQTAWLDLMDYPTATQVTVNGRTYKVGGGCHQFVLYYINAYGGWDTFTVKAKTEQFDDVAHYVQEQVYDNSHTYARGKRNYVNELTHRYTFHTSWMGEAASLRMHHLLNSPLVLCHDVVRNIIRPLVLTNTLTEYKHGGRLYQYTIEAELAQNRERR